MFRTVNAAPRDLMNNEFMNNGYKWKKEEEAAAKKRSNYNRQFIVKVECLQNALLAIIFTV